MADTAKYTKGPWRIVDEPYLHIRAGEGSGVCVLAGDYCSDADRKLVICAPGMAEMLLALIDRNRGVDHIEVEELLKKAGVL